MSLDLVDDSKTYELEHPSGAFFILKHWTVGMQEEVDRKCLVQDGKGTFTYNVSLERETKIQLSLQDWRGINFDGAAAACTQENKRKLPVGVMLWLVREIDDRAGLRMPDAEKKS